MNSLPTIPLFPAGRVVATPGALALLEQVNKSPVEFLSRHFRGDWGDLCSEDKTENELSLKHGFSDLEQLSHQRNGKALDHHGSGPVGDHTALAYRVLKCHSPEPFRWLDSSFFRRPRMRPQGKAKLGFFPLPSAEADRLRGCLTFPPEFSAVDACVGDGVAFTTLLRGTHSRSYGIEIDANRCQQARSLGIDTLQADTMDVRCPAESVSLLYLNPPYDLEVGPGNHRRLELAFVEHTYRWLKPGGILVLVIPQPQLKACARILSEHCRDLTIYRLTEPASILYKQIAVIGARSKRHQYLRDSALLEAVRWLEATASEPHLPALTNTPAVRYEVPPSGPVLLTNTGIPLDQVEDLILDSSAYRQAGRVLLPKQHNARGRPLTPLHGGHVVTIRTVVNCW